MSHYQYENSDLSQVMDQIREQLDGVRENPSIMTDSLNFHAYTHAAEHLQYEYGYAREEALLRASEMDFDLNESDLSYDDVANAAREMIDMSMELISFFESNFDPVVSGVLKQQLFRGLKLNYG